MGGQKDHSAPCPVLIHQPYCRYHHLKQERLNKEDLLKDLEDLYSPKAVRNLDTILADFYTEERIIGCYKQNEGCFQNAVHLALKLTKNGRWLRYLL